MQTALNTKKEENYWSERYQAHNIGWDIGQPTTPIKTYIDQLKDKTIKILIPGAGNAYEAEYLYNQGFENVFVMDISPIPLKNFIDRNPNFPTKQLIEANFFEHVGQYDLILEQTFFCSFEPLKANRELYGEHAAQLLKPNGKLVGLWFDIPLIEGNMTNRPFGGSKSEYIEYLLPYFEINTFEKCYNSISKRHNQELFGIFLKKQGKFTKEIYF